MLIEDDELRHKMGIAAREFAEKHFSIENVISAHINIYDILARGNC